MANYTRKSQSVNFADFHGFRGEGGTKTLAKADAIAKCERVAKECESRRFAPILVSARGVGPRDGEYFAAVVWFSVDGYSSATIHDENEPRNVDSTDGRLFAGTFSQDDRTAAIQREVFGLAQRAIDWRTAKSNRDLPICHPELTDRDREELLSGAAWQRCYHDFRDSGICGGNEHVNHSLACEFSRAYQEWERECEGLPREAIESFVEHIAPTLRKLAELGARGDGRYLIDSAKIPADRSENCAELAAAMAG